jgi:enoyl-CoA hydratase/carnithine racemase
MYQAMADALLAAADDGAVRAVLITGQPGIFTSGNDIEDFIARPPGQGGSNAAESPVFQFMQALTGCDKPVMAAVTGAAIGIGTTMLLHCDFVYVADDARLAMPFVGLGLVPEFASSLLVPQLMGHRRAAEKLLLGEPFGAEQAVELRHRQRGAAGGRGGEPRAPRRRALQRAAAGRGARGQAADARAAARAGAAGDRRGGRAVRRPAAQPGGDGGFQAFFQKRRPDFSKFS